MIGFGGVVSIQILAGVLLVRYVIKKTCKRKGVKQFKEEIKTQNTQIQNLENSINKLKNIKQQNLKIIEETEEIRNNKQFLSKGGFGEVYKTRYQEKDVVFKSLYSHINSTQELAYFIKEIIILSKTPQHENINQALGYEILYEKDKNCFECRIYFEFANRRDLNQFMLTQQGYQQFLQSINQDEQQKIQIQLKLMKDICEGLQFLHMQNILHLDLKPPNVLIHQDENGEYIAKITDFGISKQANHTIVTQIEGISPRYMPVEYGEVDSPNSQISKKTDIWSLGCLFLVIFGQVQPWEKSNSIYQVSKLVMEKKDIFSYMGDETLEKIRPIRQILAKCLNHNYKKRAEIDEILCNIIEVQQYILEETKKEI